MGHRNHNWNGPGDRRARGGFGGRPGDCPVTEDISDRLLRLPFYNDLSETDQDFVVESLFAFKDWQ